MPRRSISQELSFATRCNYCDKAEGLLRGGCGELLLIDETTSPPRPVRKRPFGLNRRREAGQLWGFDLRERRSMVRSRRDSRRRCADGGAIKAMELPTRQTQSSRKRGWLAVGRRAPNAVPRAARHDDESSDGVRWSAAAHGGPRSRDWGRNVSMQTMCPCAQAGQSRSETPVKRWYRSR